MTPAEMAVRLNEILKGKIVQEVIVNGSQGEPIGLLIRTELGESVGVSAAESKDNDIKLAFRVMYLVDETLFTGPSHGKA